MSLLRSAIARPLRQHRLPRLPKSAPYIGSARQTAGRRGYSTAHDAADKAKSVAGGLMSELPWIVTALAVTIPGTYWILANGSWETNSGLPGSQYHGEGHDEEHDEEEEEDEEDAGDAAGDEDEGEAKEGGANDEEEAEKEDGDNAEAEDKKEGSDDKADDESEEDDSSKGESETKRKEGKNVSEQPKEDKLSKKSKDGKDAKFSETVELDNGDSDSKKLHVPDAKGGAKRRIESAAGKKVGEETEGGVESASGKDPEKDSMVKKQAGLSNTDTKHPLADDPEKSRKESGVLDTAKLQGTVDPNRPAR